MTTHRPYLAESVVAGDRFNLASFGAFILFLFVIGTWIYSSRGLLGRAGEVFGIFKPEEKTAGFFQQAVPASAGLSAGNSSGGPEFYSVGTQTQTQTTQDIVAQVIKENYPTYTPQPTYTPYPTYTPQPTYTPYPGISNFENEQKKYLLNRGTYEFLGIYSYYWPPLGGINCDTNPDGSPECEYTASGALVSDWIGNGCACPASVPFGSDIYIRELDIHLTCIDRGGLIYVDGFGRYWIDQLIEQPLIPYGSQINIVITVP